MWTRLRRDGDCNLKTSFATSTLLPETLNGICIVVLPVALTQILAACRRAEDLFSNEKTVDRVLDVFNSVQPRT